MIAISTMLLLHRICLNEETLCPYRYSIYDIHRRWAVSVWSLPGVQGFCHVKVWRMQKRICYSPRGSCRVSIDPWMDSLGLPIRERFAFPLSSRNLRLSCTAKLILNYGLRGYFIMECQWGYCFLVLLSPRFGDCIAMVWSRPAAWGSLRHVQCPHRTWYILLYCVSQ